MKPIIRARLAPQTETMAKFVDTDFENEAPLFSVVLPCHNEEDAILQTVAQLRHTLKDAGPYELIVVNDGSTDNTAALLAQAVEEDPTLCVLTHPENRGYGASLKTGLLNSASETIVITDADGTYPNHVIPQMLELAEEYDMVVGARTGGKVVYPLIRKIPKVFLRAYASWIASRSIPDINSGLRVFPRAAAERFINILPNGFSFTTTITLAMLTNNYRVSYFPVDYSARIGSSKIRPISDTLKFLRLIACTGMYFAPLRVLLPIAAILTAAFCGSACYDLFIERDMTEKTLVLLMLSTNSMLFTLLSDMIVKKSGELNQTQITADNARRHRTVKVTGRMPSRSLTAASEQKSKAA